VSREFYLIEARLLLLSFLLIKKIQNKYRKSSYKWALDGLIAVVPVEECSLPGREIIQQSGLPCIFGYDFGPRWH
jgi:hypothetical protein